MILRSLGKKVTVSPVRFPGYIIAALKVLLYSTIKKHRPFLQGVHVKYAKANQLFPLFHYTTDHISVYCGTLLYAPGLKWPW